MPPQAMTTTPPAASSTATSDASDKSAPARLPGPDMSVVALGRVLYTRYLWTIELAGTLLLVAACGAIMIAQRESSSQPGASA